jgi:hypothetical protein
VIHTNWHTSETRSEGALFGSEPRTPFDLDSEALDPIGPVGTDFVVGSGRVLDHVRTGRRQRGHAIELQRGERRRRIYRCIGPCRPISLKGGLALWVNGPDSLYGYALEARRRATWWMPDTAVVTGSTARRVYYVTPSAAGAGLMDFRSFRWRR